MAAKREDVRNGYGKLIGYISYMANGDANGYHLRKGLVGYYRKSLDRTLDLKCKPYCTGNCLQSLIIEAEASKK